MDFGILEGGFLPLSGPRRSFGVIPGPQGSPGVVLGGSGGPRGPKWSETLETRQIRNPNPGKSWKILSYSIESSQIMFRLSDSS